jgi:hypothetical protein
MDWSATSNYWLNPRPAQCPHGHWYWGYTRSERVFGRVLRLGRRDQAVKGVLTRNDFPRGIRSSNHPSMPIRRNNPYWRQMYTRS